MSDSRPSAVQYVMYCYGRVLPDSMRNWVRHDLAGKGAGLRTVVRFTIPVVILLAPLLAIPTTLYVRCGMTIPIFIPFVYFAIALNPIYRRHRLSQHGLDPDLADERKRQREAQLREDYERRFHRL